MLNIYGADIFMKIEIIVYLIAIIGALGYNCLGIWSQRETKKLASMQRNIEINK